MNRKWWLIGGGAVALIVVVIGVWLLFFRDDAPDEVSNEAANADLDQVLAEQSDDPEVDEAGDSGEEPSPAPTDAPVPTDPPAPEGIDGLWSVDDEIGEFDFDTASGSFAGFRVAEELSVVGDVTAVGRSGGVAGSVTIEGETLIGAEVTVDMATIVSNDSRRENAIRRTIKASEFPTATFTFGGGLDVSALEVGGAPQAFTVEGDLTVAGVTNATTFAIEANVRDDGFAVITGSTELTWADFGIETPTAPIVVSVADQGTVEFQLIAARV